MGEKAQTVVCYRVEFTFKTGSQKNLKDKMWLTREVLDQMARMVLRRNLRGCTATGPLEDYDANNKQG